MIENIVDDAFHLDGKNEKTTRNDIPFWFFDYHLLIITVAYHFSLILKMFMDRFAHIGKIIYFFSLHYSLLLNVLY